MQYGLDFVRLVRQHSTQGASVNFDTASQQVRGQLLQLLKALDVADRNHRSGGGAAVGDAPLAATHPAVEEITGHSKRLQIIMDEPELDGDGFIAEMKLLINVARGVQGTLPDGDAKDRIGVAVCISYVHFKGMQWSADFTFIIQAKALLQRGIAFRSAQSGSAKVGVIDAANELCAAVQASLA